MIIKIAKPIIGQAEITAITKVLKSGQVARGPVSQLLEQEFAHRFGCRYAVAVNSGTAALFSALWSLGIKPGDEVITTPFTFVATANAILMCGALPVFADIDPLTFNLDPNSVETKITSQTKAILPVNLYGQPANYTALKRIARKYHLHLIEDAAQSINAKYGKRYSGNLVDLACFSFYATKNIMCGEGGMITSNHPELIQKILRFIDHGQTPGDIYHYRHLGYNFQLPDLLSSLVLAQLSRLDQITAKRQAHAQLYTHHLSDLNGLILPTVAKLSTHVFHQYTIRVTSNFPLNRNELQHSLLNLGIQTAIYYPTPLYRFKHLLPSIFNPQHFPETEKASNEVLSLPVHPSLTKKELFYVVNSIKELSRKLR